MKLRQSKGNNSPLTDDTPIKLHMHNLTMVIYIPYKFYEIPFITAEDKKTDKLQEGQCETYIPPHFAGDKKNVQVEVSVCG